MTAAPLRVAIVGSGPSGLYAAADLLKRNPQAEVHLFDRLPTPGGLVRFGVSPDHAARRAVIEVYERIVLGSGRYRFFGNVEIGRHLQIDELRAHYAALIFASGATDDRRLGIAGEDMPGSYSATEFVAWYNGHPDQAQRSFDLSGTRAVVIGNGNVALDVGRILLLGAARLQHTDIADHALKALADSRIREVIILGRRGPAQASFTAPELLELQALDDIDVIVEPAMTAAEWDAAAQGLDYRRQLRLQLIRELAQRPSRNLAKRLVLRFLASPQQINGESRVESLQLAKNRLSLDVRGGGQAEPTGSVETLAASLVLRAVGYRGRALSGLPFDEKSGTLPNSLGRVEGAAGVYVVGWAKRGPRGVIGTNKSCSQETVAELLLDHAAGRLPSTTRASIDTLLAQRQPDSVDVGGWKAIDRHERRLGAAQQRPRIKLTSVAEMLRVPNADKSNQHGYRTTT